MLFSEKKSLKNYLWRIKQYDERNSLAIHQKFGFSEIISRLLTLKNISLDEVETFMDPTIRNHLKNPNSLLDMEKGVNIVYEEILKKGKICIFGDYDVDGVSSSALMKKFFDEIKVNSIVYIPNRMSEGYGPNIEAFKKLRLEYKVDLVVTVDCGISAFEPCKCAKEMGMKVVVSDHHLGDVCLPEADAIINPNRFDETSEYKNLAGVGVAFLFLVVLNKKLRNEGYYIKNDIKEPYLLKFLDLVALGTVCDVVSLTGLNRAFVNQGLKIIHKRLNVGIRSLIDASDIDEEINPYHIGFILGPRLNATGRIAESDLSSKLLYMDDEFEAKQTANILNAYNTERQNIEKIVLEQAIKQIESKELYNDDIIFVEGKNWHEGIIGIIASRIKDKYERPSIILSKSGNSYRASCRSVYGVDIGSAIIEGKMKGLISDGGGHAMAGGFSVPADKFDELKTFFFEKLGGGIKSYLNNKEKEVDLILECKSLSINLAKEVDKLGPFGAGNHKPKIILKDVVIVRADLVGKNQTNLKIIVSDDDIVSLRNSVTAMCFRVNQGDKIFNTLSQRGKKVNLLGELNVNKWMGQEHLQFLIEDVLE